MGVDANWVIPTIAGIVLGGVFLVFQIILRPWSIPIRAVIIALRGCTRVDRLICFCRFLWSTKREFACAMIDRRPISHEFDRSGWLNRSLETWLAWTNALSIGQFLRLIARRIHWERKDQHGGFRWIEPNKKENNWIDAYVIAVLLSFVGLYAAVRWTDRSWLEWISVVFVLYVLAEMIARNLNVTLYDHIRKHRSPASNARSVFLGIVNYAQVIIGFAVLVQFFVVDHEEFGSKHCDFQDSLWASTKAATLIDFPRCNEGFVRTLFAAEAFVALFVLVILIAWGIANLPRRAAE